MELREYFRMVGKHSAIFLIIVILATLAAFVFTKLQPDSYLGSTTLTVNKGSSYKQKDVPFYLFDNYYNVQSSGLFSQIVVNWFESPSLVKEIYDKAGVPLPNVKQSDMSKIFKAVREEPATINLSVIDADKETVSKLINAASSVIQEKTDDLGKNSESFYEISKFPSLVTSNNPNIVLNTFIGLIAGLLLGVIFTLGIEYFKSGKR
jgi:capsular polysaccharide biosynthesis protein